MIFEFLIVVRLTEDAEIVDVIHECLSKVLIDNLNEFDDEAVKRMVIPRVQRDGDYNVKESGEPYCRTLFGFMLELPEETASPRIVVDEFSEALKIPPVIHLVKFDDPLIYADLACWTDEIYTLEMKLRRVLTFVYLHAYQDGDPYELLREEFVQPMTKERPNPEYMKDRSENQFFYLTFSQYIGLNRRQDFKLTDLLDLVRNKGAYEGFREELARAPVEDENDAVLLAGLKSRMEAIEAMRNCCAHSRRPSKTVEENYINALPLLNQLLDDHLARWEWQEQVEEMPWDLAARLAVENAMENTYWNNAERTITLFNADDGRIRETVGSREELDNYLTNVASAAFYANVPRVDGEFLHKCDEYGILETVLGDYEDQLEEYFSSNV